jgi:threonine aldolase
MESSDRNTLKINLLEHVLIGKSVNFSGTCSKADGAKASMDFASDNTAGASPKVLDAIIAANQGATAAYGADPYSAKAERLIGEVFEKDTKSFLVATGTAANSLALGAVTPPWGAVFCHEGAHIIEDECGAPEMFTAGAKLVGIPGHAGKIAPDDLRATLAAFPRGAVKQVQPAAVSLSQATECGTIYTCEEIECLATIAHEAGLAVHMDGARFANALVTLGCTAAEMTWKSGIDILSFGATKNGALACEAVVFFDPAKAANFPFQRKRSGHTVSKGRLLGAQMVAYLENGHWLGLAKIANANALHLIEGLAKVTGVRLPWPRQVNEIFAILPRSVDAALKAGGAVYYDWSTHGRDADLVRTNEDEVFIRLVTSFATQATEIDQFIATAIGGSNS